MAKICELTGVGPTAGNKVSHSNRHTRKRWLPNLHDKKLLIPELGLTANIRLSSKAIRTITKQGGITNAILEAKSAKLSPELLKIQTKLVKQRKAPTAKK